MEFPKDGHRKGERGNLHAFNQNPRRRRAAQGKQFSKVVMTKDFLELVKISVISILKKPSESQTK